MEPRGVGEWAEAPPRRESSLESPCRTLQSVISVIIIWRALFQHSHGFLKSEIFTKNCDCVSCLTGFFHGRHCVLEPGGRFLVSQRPIFLFFPKPLCSSIDFSMVLDLLHPDRRFGLPLCSLLWFSGSSADMPCSLPLASARIWPSPSKQASTSWLQQTREPGGRHLA